jgi:hypothetical protein
MRNRLSADRASFIEPCLPSPADKAPSGASWIHEIKHDGFRLMARRDPVGIRLITRRGNDWTARYPLVVEAVNHLKVGGEARSGRGLGSVTSKPRRRSNPQPIPQHTWQGFIAYAESFGHAAVYVSNGIHLMHNAPVGALACHCIELSLKAVLLNRGYTAEQVLDFRHNLNKLFSETRHAGLDWSDLDTKAIAFYAKAVLEHAFRYRNSARPCVFDDQEILAFTETVFMRCARALGARRSLSPRPKGRLGPRRTAS